MLAFPNGHIAQRMVVPHCMDSSKPADMDMARAALSILGFDVEHLGQFQHFTERERGLLSQRYVASHEN